MIVAALILATAAAYAPTANNGFVPRDDEAYVSGNRVVQAGLTRQGLVWAFTNFGYANNWHPVTWVSHMLDVELFGVDPGAHHVAGLAIHAASATLLILALVLATGRLWASAAVGALFALHPLHVESVAWIAERKDVLSGLFFALGLLSYVHYSRKPGLGRWLLVSFVFACGLLAKPSLVTFPALLLLFDYWPLGRFPRHPAAPASGPAFRRCVLEKVPWVIMASAVGIVTFLVQKSTGTGEILRPLSLAARFCNAVVAYAWYVAKAFWPVNLSFFYPHSEGYPPLLLLAASAALLGAVSWLVVARRATYPFALMGWCWYLGTLVPMVGLIQIGGQAWADRYAYLPLTGVFILVVWALPRSFVLRPLPAALASAGIVLVLVAFSVATNRQVLFWRDGESLFRRGLAMNPGNTSALVGLGSLYLQRGRHDEAAALFFEALRRNPSEVEAHIGLGVYYSKLGMLQEEAASYERGLAASPENPRLFYNLILAYRDLGRTDEALAISRRLQAITERYRSRWYSRGFR